MVGGHRKQRRGGWNITRTQSSQWEKRGWDKTGEEDRFQRNGGRTSFLPTALRQVIMSGLPTRLSSTKIHHTQNEVLYSHTLQTIKYVQKRWHIHNCPHQISAALTHTRSKDYMHNHDWESCSICVFFSQLLYSFCSLQKQADELNNSITKGSFQKNNRLCFADLNVSVPGAHAACTTFSPQWGPGSSL